MHRGQKNVIYAQFAINITKCTNSLAFSISPLLSLSASVERVISMVNPWTSQCSGVSQDDNSKGKCHRSTLSLCVCPFRLSPFGRCRSLAIELHYTDERLNLSIATIHNFPHPKSTQKKEPANVCTENRFNTLVIGGWYDPHLSPHHGPLSFSPPSQKRKLIAAECLAMKRQKMKIKISPFWSLLRSALMSMCQHEFKMLLMSRQCVHLVP